MGQAVNGVDLSIYDPDDALEKSEQIAEKYIKNIYGSNFTSQQQEELDLVSRKFQSECSLVQPFQSCDEFQSSRKDWKRKEYSDSDTEDENALFYKQSKMEKKKKVKISTKPKQELVPAKPILKHTDLFDHDRDVFDIELD